MTCAAGDVIGRYRVVRLLGAGGMGISTRTGIEKAGGIVAALCDVSISSAAAQETMPASSASAARNAMIRFIVHYPPVSQSVIDAALVYNAFPHFCKPFFDNLQQKLANCGSAQPRPGRGWADAAILCFSFGAGFGIL